MYLRRADHMSSKERTKQAMTTFFLPELLYCSDGRFRSSVGLLVSDGGQILGITEKPDGELCNIVNLKGKALLPGFINSHSHSFQRLIRGKSESRCLSGTDFWSWRELMYYAAGKLDAADIYDVARMAFLEMALTGITTVGEFHYLHRAPNGSPYDDPNLLSKTIIDAACSVGLRIVLLRVAYQRSGYDVCVNPGQARFFESTRDYLENTAALLDEFPAGSERVRIGVAPHSIRAVPLESLGEIIEWARKSKLPIHMHVAEQPDEVSACEREYGSTPLALLEREKLLGPDFTAVHAIHVSEHEMDQFAETGGTICSCPTTERNLGDGVVSADQLAVRGIRIAVGSDSQVQIDPLEDARGLDYHLRLTRAQRVILDRIRDEELSTRLFTCATANGARSLMARGGDFKPGSPADFFAVDLSDPCIAGSSGDDLLPLIVFSLNRSAICDVAVGGKLIVREQSHALQQEIISRYQDVHRKLWTQPLVSAS
jgi:formimidoylglutamate deiminase